VGDLWRTSEDIIDKWEGTDSGGDLGLMNILDLQPAMRSYSGPGHWTDPDMGNGGMTLTEYAAPLIAGNNLSNMKPEIQQILTNKEVIAVDQDPLGRPGERVLKDGDLEVWSKQMRDGGRAVVLLNRDEGRARSHGSLARPWLCHFVTSMQVSLNECLVRRLPVRPWGSRVDCRKMANCRVA
jgi:alpha-galactosidase